ncbi:hypothetical protein OR16_08527 [Cupriavidus basilensis OR16]|uniref:DUF1643 domain-containing protein n=1 Tax=Cupriavidus basilensis OR16 TaxID=1127483 RepID=H1S203_9BURK|nr:DUF1643 domain-containing protein [Cupriavidus basilensis]EHP43497.1 hypothetical protein OR16_08527 [Cupriavidus basilensis OR16]
MKHLTTPTLDGEAGAILSDCEQYRYRLWREWNRSQPALDFIMRNPSTADHRVNDPTITRCLQRALAGRYGRLVFPLRSTDPDVLLTDPALLGREDTANCSIMDALDRCSLVICAWGAHRAAPARGRGGSHRQDVRPGRPAPSPRAQPGRQPEAPLAHRSEGVQFRLPLT